MTIISTNGTARGTRSSLAGIVNWQTILMLVVAVVLAVTFDALSDGVFLTSRNISILLRQSAVLGVVACGVAILITMSEIDLSIGSAVYLVGVCAATAETSLNLGLPSVVVIALGVGLLLGAWQGFCVSVVGVPSFIVTLTGLLAFRGFGLYWTDARTLAPLLDSHVALSESFVDLPTSIIGTCILIVIFTFLTLRKASARRRRGDEGAIKSAVAQIAVMVICAALLLFAVSGYRGLPTAVLWTLALGGILWFVMTRTLFGRNAYMIGANRAAAALSGVNVERNVFSGFLLMGALYGIGGLLFTARLNASTAGDATFLELDAIAASVIGGVALSGGKGRIPSVLAGALLLSTIDNGMSVIGVSSFLQEIVKGGILLAAVTLDVRFRRK